VPFFWGKTAINVTVPLYTYRKFALAVERLFAKRAFPPWLKPHEQQCIDGGTEVPPLQSKGNRRGKGDNKNSHKDKSRSSDSSDTIWYRYASLSSVSFQIAVVQPVASSQVFRESEVG
jgi:hypothetical protein